MRSETRSDPGLDLGNVQPIILVVDASESAEPHWAHVARAAGALRDLAREVYVLGGDAPVDGDIVAGEGAAFPHQLARRCSLISPILEALLRHARTRQTVVVVGSGRIWDLDDWLRRPPVGRWLLVRAGPDRLGPDDPDCPEVPATELPAALRRLAGQVLLREGQGGGTASAFWSSTQFQWLIDRAGFPMVYVEPLAAYVHLFPVAKAQFERYLWQHSPSEWGDVRYAQLLALNPRASPAELPDTPYERLFVTGILPGEIPPFARWLGPGAALPDIGAWLAALRWMEAQPATPVPPELARQGLSQAAADIWQALFRARSPRSLLDLALLVEGVVEWVQGPPSPSGGKAYGMGAPRACFFPTAKQVERPLVPIDPSRRLAHFGFRLARRI